MQRIAMSLIKKRSTNERFITIGVSWLLQHFSFKNTTCNVDSSTKNQYPYALLTRSCVTDHLGTAMPSSLVHCWFLQEAGTMISIKMKNFYTNFWFPCQSDSKSKQLMFKWFLGVLWRYSILRSFFRRYYPLNTSTRSIDLTLAIISCTFSESQRV